MADLSPLALLARRAQREKEAARVRSLSRRAMGPLFWKYLEVVPSVFSARGDLYGFRLLVPRAEVLRRLKNTAVLTLDSATEVLGDFRFGRARNDYAYFATAGEVAAIEAARLGERRPGTHFPFAWTPPGREMLFAVVPREVPPNLEAGGVRVVTVEHLVRELIGYYGLRADLLATVEAKLKPDLGTTFTS